MATDYQNLRTYRSYSEYKIVCQKQMSTINGDEGKILQLFDVLNQDSADDIYLLKVNALLDTTSTTSNSLP